MKGPDGKNGENAPDVMPQKPMMDRCFHCPHGPMVSGGIMMFR